MESSSHPGRRKLAAIMFTDMVGYTALAQRDERLALDLLERHRRRLRPLFAQHDGHEIKTLGDGFLVEFASPLEAVRCAIAIQGALRDDAAASPPERRVQVRIGIHLGDVVEREGDLVGDGVNLASRIQGVADPGGICISRPVFDQVRNKVDVPLVPLRSAQLKNVQVPMEVFRVASSSQAATAASPTRRAVRRAAALLVAATVAAGVWGLWAQRERRTTGSDRATPSIAVLPFVNMSASAENEYLSDGISEEITGVLSRIAGLRVAARTSAFVFKGRNEDIENIGRQLHVGTVLEGSVQRAGNRLRITAQLIDAGNGYHLWSDTYDRDVADVFAIQSDVAERVAEALEVELGMETREQIRRPPTQNVEAYQLYLKGRYYTSRYTREAMAKGMEYFQQAIALDPSYALAYTGLGYYYAVSDDAPLPPREAITKMREAAEKALAIDPTLGDAHGQLAAVRWWWDWDAAAAEREYRRAIELQEQSVLTHGLFALFLVSVGRTEEGLAHNRRAVELDPLSLEPNTWLALTLVLSRRYEEAIAQARQTLEMDPTYWYARVVLADAYALNGRLDDAVRELEAAVRPDDPAAAESVWTLGWAYGLAGRRDAALKIVDSAQRKRAAGEHFSAFGIAAIYTALGDKDRAFEWLDRAFEERSWSVPLVAVNPALDVLRSDARFAPLVARIDFANNPVAVHGGPPGTAKAVRLSGHGP